MIERRRRLPGARALAAIASIAILLAATTWATRRSGPIGRMLDVGGGYSAKVLASAVFVSGRDPVDVVREDLDDPPFLRWFRTDVDRRAKTVRASFFGRYERTAVCAPGAGCVLLPPGQTEPPVFFRPRSMPDGPAEDGWPAVEPIDGADVASIEEAVEEAFREPSDGGPRRTRAIVVVHDGRLVAERYAPGIGRDTPLPGWSMAKTVVGALVGIAVSEGRLDLARPIDVPEWIAGDDPRRSIPLEAFLRMTDGLAFDEDYGDPFSDVNAMLWRSRSAGARAALAPPAAAPGSRWRYSSGSTNLIARALAAGLPGGRSAYLGFPRSRLFGPIGMRSAVFETDASGGFVGSSFLYATARDWARFGQLLLDDGVWRGERVLPAGWVDLMRTPTPGAPLGCYGAHVWLNAGDARGGRPDPALPADLLTARGYQGQILAVAPSRRVVVVRLGATPSREWGFPRFLSRILDALPP